MTLQSVSECLQSSLKPSETKRDLTLVETDVVSNAKACEDAALELTKNLKRFSMSDKDKKRSEWEALCRAVKALWANKDVERLRQNLETSRQALVTAIQAFSQGLDCASHHCQLPHLGAH